MSAFLRSCEKSNDRMISMLASGLLNRHLYKAKDMTDALNENVELVLSFFADAKDKIKSLGGYPEYLFTQDRAADTPYKPYDPAQDEPTKIIIVENTLGNLREITNVS